jgi:hypothetical protein
LPFQRNKSADAGEANCFRSNLKGMEAGCNNFLGLRSKPTTLSGMDAVSG